MSEIATNPVATPVKRRSRRNLIVLLVLVIAGLAYGGFLLNERYGYFDGTADAREAISSMLADLGQGKSIGDMRFEASDTWGALESTKFDSITSQTTYNGKTFVASGIARFSRGAKHFDFTVRPNAGHWELVKGQTRRPSIIEGAMNDTP